MMQELLVGYLAIGCAVVGISPGRGLIAKEIRRVRGSELTRVFLGYEASPAWKVVAFGLILSAGAVLFWPIVVSHLIGVWAESRRSRRELQARLAQGLEFSMLGGGGELECEDCGHRQEIVSFTHGALSGPNAFRECGVQCLDCGRFQSLVWSGDGDEEPVSGCECGGELSRTHFLFCPKCRSKSLSYSMRYIT
jgi:hypothetical protein